MAIVSWQERVIEVSSYGWAITMAFDGKSHFLITYIRLHCRAHLAD